MKRYASHCILSPCMEWIRLHMVEINEETIKLFPIYEEAHSVEWLPGVILLLPKKRNSMDNKLYFENTLLSAKKAFKKEVILTFHTEEYSIFHLFPFDFTLMRPVAGTQSKQLL